MDKGLDITSARAVLACHAALGANPRGLADVSRALGNGAHPVEAFRRVARATGARPDEAAAGRALDWLAADRRQLLVLGGAAYPPLLAEIPLPPPLLFVAGDAALLAAPQVAVVGSRKASPGALTVARDLGHDLAAASAVVTSGMALGVDGAAHRGALAGGGATVAVFGCGIDRVYPARHRALAGEIAASGALVSEFPLGSAPLPRHFPQRNRVIAGLSLGVVVVEAAARSGSMSTARHALEQGREVFAVPGSVLNPNAAGCHALLRDGAALVASAADVLAEFPRHFDGSAGASGAPAAPPPPPLDRGAETLLAACDFAPTSIDEMVFRSGLTVQEVCSMLLPLELAGRVEARADGTYVRLR
ncbi:MAG: DNA-processing protein DprA [Gammaproteobacteria bacterium]